MDSLRSRLFDYGSGLPLKIIPAEREPGVDDTLTPLFERYFVGQWRIPGDVVTCYLHHYLRSDPDRGVHDHPWNWAVALPLAGGYDEERFAGIGGGEIHTVIRRRRPGIPYRLTGNDFHRVLVPTGETSWSLFFTGRYAKGWGFLNPHETIAGGRIDERAALRDIIGGQALFRYTRVEAPDSGKAKWWTTAPLGRDVEGRAPHTP